MMAYGTDQGFTDWLAAMGYVLPVGSPTAAVLRARGTAYLDGVYERLWTGVRTDGVVQELGWPRTGAMMHCVSAIDSTAIPAAVVNASYRAGWLEASNAGVLSVGIVPGQRIASEKVDVIAVSYHNDGASSLGIGGTGYLDSEIDGAMRSFICNDTDAGKFFFRSIGSDCG